MKDQDLLAQILDFKDARHENLEAEIRDLYFNNFERLLWVLYRLDVNEIELKNALKQSNLPIQKVITQLLLTRCNEIINTRIQSEKITNSTKNWSFDLDDEM